MSGPLHIKPVPAKLVRREDGKLMLRSPTVGLWRDAPHVGALVTAGAPIGAIEVLGALHAVVAPKGTHGLVVERGGDESLARRPVGWGTTLLVLDPEVAGVASTVDDTTEAGQSGGGLVFRAPTSGRQTPPAATPATSPAVANRQPS